MSEQPDVCVECGRLPTINGNHETVIMIPGEPFKFRHGVCDDRWDEPPNYGIKYGETVWARDKARIRDHNKPRVPLGKKPGG